MSDMKDFVKLADFIEQLEAASGDDCIDLIEHIQSGHSNIPTPEAIRQVAHTGGEVQKVLAEDATYVHSVNSNGICTEIYTEGLDGEKVEQLYTAPPAVVAVEVTESDAPAFLWGGRDRHHWVLGYNECIADHFTAAPQPGGE